MKKVIIYTDGSCLRNPGPGGWAAILRLANTEYKREIFGGYRLTTNNRMEIVAALEALKALKESCEVSLHSDSQYLCNAVQKGWIKSWERANWLRKDKPVPNADLWQKLVQLMLPHNIHFYWLAGHAGQMDNERCDDLARKCASQGNLPPDEIYEALAKKQS